MSGDDAGAASRRRAAIGLAIGFFVLQIPILSDFTPYHGDERFYTDAAIGMVQSGDWLTPRYPDGSLRFEKPLLGYLVLAGSYATLGIDLLASRLPFLMAGSLLVWVTWWASLRLLHDGEAALLAAAIVAATPDTLALAQRSTPDALLCLFLLLGLTGFALLLRDDEGRRGAGALAWLGTGLAAAAKGGLGPVLVAYAVACAALSRERSRRLRRLLHPVWLPLGLLLGVAGFGVYALGHGAAELQRSVSDQVGGRVRTLGDLTRTFAAYAIIPFEHLSPWVALVALGALRDRGSIAQIGERAGWLARFAAGWLLVLITIFSAADVVRGRYLAPAYPLLVIVLAFALITISRRAVASALLRRVCVPVLWLAAIGGIVLAAGGARIDPSLLVAGLVCAAAAGGSLVAGRAGTASHVILGLAITLLVVQTVGVQAVRTVFSPTPVEAIAARLLDPALAGARVAQVGESAHLASKLRVATGGRVWIDGFARGGAPPDWNAYDVIVSDLPLPDAVAALGFRSEACGAGAADEWTPGEVRAILGAADPRAAIARRAQPYSVAIRARETGG